MTAPDRRTTAGLVRGSRSRDLLVWRGIPYAAPPVGPLRLRAPQPVAPWSGVRDASAFGPQAPQPVRGPARLQPPMSEDCLTLNIVAPALQSGDRRPVMVFLHGGGYTIGSARTGLYGGQALARRGDLVYVSIQYRLGVLGYLDFTSVAGRPVESNLGLRDQVAALSWVRDNIAAFGGDPERVTIFGESAGGNAVTTLMATPSAAGLFSAAIAQSPAPASVVTRENAAGSARRVVDRLGGADRLFDASPEELVAAAEVEVMSAVDTVPGSRMVAPVIDGEVLPEHPLDAFEAGRATRVPLVIGTNDREGVLFPRVWDILATNPERIEGMFARTDPAARDRVVAAYPGYPGTDAAVDLGGDSIFWWPSTLVAQAHAKVAPTWVYRYDYAPRLLRALRFGATHGTELPAVFGYGLGVLGALGGRRTVRAVSDRVQAHWLEVARRGAPLPSWPPYGDARSTLVFDEVDRVEVDPRRERRLAWSGYRPG
ncbi:MAG TPA: carboxylesterase/lipase family protein [Mycobacteriales bacterium]|nr:carboxylesterase/lipase family protein [Mycobacteriales bacterium]